MTSANSVEYTIYDKNGKEVGHHRQNIMCSKCNDGLEKFKPANEFSIKAWGYDEEEDLWENEESHNLLEWLNKNPASFTFRRFQPQDTVKVDRKRGEGVVLEVIKGTFTNSYKVQLSNGDVIEVGQNEVMYVNL